MGLSSSLRYPNKSHRKAIVVPEYSAALAEFFGIMIGDGGINNPWQANVTLNSEADASYILFVIALMHSLFGVTPRVMHRKTRKATVVSLASTSVVDFLVEKGLPRGNKLAQGLRIPDWILTRKTYKMACVRGLMDTDGCLVLHRHRIAGKDYKNLYLSFSSASLALLEQVTLILLDLELTPYLANSKREINLYRLEDVEKYLRVVGTSNERIRRVYEKWRDG